MKKVLAVVPNGFEEIELLQTVDMLRGSKLFSVTMVSLIDEKELVGCHNVKIITDFDDRYLTNENLAAYDLLLVPGGKGCVNYIKPHQAFILKNIVKFFFENHKLVAAICGAPLVLDYLKLIKNYSIAVAPSVSDQVVNNKIVKKRVVLCDNLITASGPSDTPFFALKIIEVLVGKEKALAYQKQHRYNFCTEENNFIE